MTRSGRTAMRAGLILVAAVAVIALRTEAAPFTFLQAGFTQELYGTAPGFLGGVAFASDGDVWVDTCSTGGSPLHRFDQQTTTVVNATIIHPEVLGSPFSSNAGCGLTNHPNGALYSNLFSGVVKLDASTGTPLAGPFGSGGNGLGITTDPQTGNLVYVGLSGTIFFVDAGFTTSGTFSSVTTGNFVDGIFFDPTGNFLFLSNRSPFFRLTILRRDGTLVQHVSMSSEPDGIAFHGTTPKFVVTNNTDGTMTRFDFPADDFTQVPIQSVFASGGFRGDLSQVGGDGCLYLTQDGTRFDDSTTSFDDSVVRICGGFAPPPGVGQNLCTLTQGFWKTHPSAWPTSVNSSGLTIGTKTYTKTQLLKILNRSSTGNALVILAKQYIAARLNRLTGSPDATVPNPIGGGTTTVDGLLTIADGLIGSNNLLTGSVKTSSALGQQMVAVANVLDQYNNGVFTPDCKLRTASSASIAVIPTATVVTSQVGEAIIFQAQGTQIDRLQVQIFSLNGHLVVDREAQGNKLTFFGVDKTGHKLAKGVYLYVMTVRGFNGEIIGTQLKKLVILR